MRASSSVRCSSSSRLSSPRWSPTRFKSDASAEPAHVTQVDEEAAEEDPEPADLDGDRFRRQFPAGEHRVHGGQSSKREGTTLLLYRLAACGLAFARDA